MAVQQRAAQQIAPQQAGGQQVGPQSSQINIDAGLMLQAAAQSLQQTASQTSFLHPQQQAASPNVQDPSAFAAAHIQQQLAATATTPANITTHGNTASQVSFQSIPGARAIGGRR